jgi:hypothetical protein
MSSWLPITEYAVKNRVSVSTIRRRIKNNELNHKLDGGKYFILDEGDALAKSPIEVSSQGSKAINTDIACSSVEEVLDFAERSIKEITKLNQELITEKDTVIINQRKKIQDLQEELSELKMLITLLEKKQPQSKTPIY